MATSFPARGPWLTVGPNHPTVGVLAATHAMSAMAHTVVPAPMPIVSRLPARPVAPTPATMFTTAAATESRVAHHRAAVAPTTASSSAPTASAPARASHSRRPDNGLGRGTASPTPTPVTTAMTAVMAPRGVTATRSADAPTSSGPNHAARGRGTRRATATASVAAMLVAATDVISAARRPWVPHAAAGSATAAIPAPAATRAGIPARSRVIRTDMAHRAAR